MPTPLFPPEPGPHLLVSVRNVDEAREAVTGGCRILDIKDPGAGSLGMAPVEEISEIAAWVAQQSAVEVPSAAPRDESASADRRKPSLPLSVALGELTEWPPERNIPCLPEEVGLLKLGLAGCGALADWPDRWQKCREAIARTAAGTPHWVAVCYADWDHCEAPPPEEIIAAAADGNCAAVLIDTYRKNGQSLLDCFSLSDLRHLLLEIRRYGLRTAVAGSLQPGHLEVLSDLPLDVVAVRTAACRGQSRSAPVCAEQVRQLCQLLNGRHVR